MEDITNSTGTTAAPLTMKSLAQVTQEIARIFLGIKIIMIVAILIGNSLVLAVYFKFPKIRAQPYNVFIIALAITDFATGVITIPMDIYRNVVPSLFDPEDPVPWYFNNKELCLFGLYASIQPLIWSATSLVLISLDRFIATFFPLHYYKIISHTKAIFFTVLAWIVASIPLYAAVGVADQNHDPTTRCSTGRQFHPDIEKAIFYVWSAIPITICIITYLAIIIRFSYQNHDVKSQKRFTITMAIIIIVFVICLLPLFAVSFRPPALNRPQLVIFFNVALFLAHANSFMNVIIYNITNRTFRRCFGNFMCRKEIKDSSNDSKKMSNSKTEHTETRNF